MSTIPSADAKTVVRAVEALTTQVRRIADALNSTDQQRAEAANDGATTPATTCSAQRHGVGAEPRLCIRAAHHTGLPHTDDCGYRWSDTVAVYPTDSTVRITHWHPLSEQLAGERQELAGMVGAFVDAQVQQARVADEDAQRTTRRDSLLVLLARADRLVLRPRDAEQLRQHVEAEMREADTARTRAEQAEELVGVAHETSNRSEAARAEEERLRLALAAERDRWKERAEEAQAAIERAEAFAHELRHKDARRLLAALDGTEQPTT